MKLPSIEQLKAIYDRDCVDEQTNKSYLVSIPSDWRLIETASTGPHAFFHPIELLQVIVSIAREIEDKSNKNIWLHVSVCGRTSKKDFYTPNYHQFKKTKNDFFGNERYAYQVFPDKKHFINYHPHVLHLYGKLDGTNVLPDFTHGLGMI